MICYETQHGKFEFILKNEWRRLDGTMRLHRCYELIFVRSGEVTVRCGAESLSLSGGELALLYPGQIHGLFGGGECASIVFSPDLVPVYHASHADLLPESPRFLPSARALAERLFADGISRVATVGLLYLLLSEHDEQAPCRLRPYARGELAFRVLDYIEEHFTEEISLDLLADHLGYDYNYLSGCISEPLSVGFLRIVGEYRVRYACELLREGMLAVSQIATAVGYDCLRSFNRNFKSVMGTTPLVYKRSVRAAK
jgi:AraC-like DNA-binding protein